MAAKLPVLVPAGRLLSASNALGLLSAPAPANVSQRRTITRASCWTPPPNLPEPWPYKERGYSRHHFAFDGTKKRLHENSKLIVIEGNIGVGKSTIGSEIAEMLDFHHMPEFKMEDILIDRYGNDLRKFYHLFPKSMRIPDVNMFYANPMDDNTGRMQYRMLECRWEQYLNAIAHILNTGQGVVLERTPYTDFVFTNAMRVKNYVGPEFFKIYYYMRKKALPFLRYWPHLVIYLDAPVETCLQRIKQRGNPNEIATLDEEYLKTIEESYKDALREFKDHSKILAYDWTVPGDADTIVQDIEKIDFDFFEWHSGDVFEEWFQPIDDVWYSIYRYRATDKWELYMQTFNGIPDHEAAELYVDVQDLGHFVNSMKRNVFGDRYGPGYYPNKGDDKKAAMRAWKWAQQLPEKWFEYYWRDIYFHRLHCYEAYLDPDAVSYNPDYLHHH